jgi:hypothetical protein
MDEKEKKVKKFGLWMVIVFAAVFAVVESVLFIATGSNGFSSIMMGFTRGWPVYLLTAVIVIAVYFIYRVLVLRKK